MRTPNQRLESGQRKALLKAVYGDLKPTQFVERLRDDFGVSKPTAWRWLRDPQRKDGSVSAKAGMPQPVIDELKHRRGKVWTDRALIEQGVVEIFMQTVISGEADASEQQVRESLRFIRGIAMRSLDLLGLKEPNMAAGHAKQHAKVARSLGGILGINADHTVSYSPPSAWPRQVASTAYPDVTPVRHAIIQHVAPLTFAFKESIGSD